MIGAHPVMNPWITIPTTLDTIQYRARPLSKFNVKKPNISGISQSIILLVDACCAFIDGMVVIFCISHIDAPTSTGSRKLNGAGLLLENAARSIDRNWPFSGTTWWTWGSHA